MTLTEARAKLAEAGFTLLCVTAEAWRHNWDSSQTEGYVVTVLRPYSHSVRGHSLSALVAAVLADKAVRDAAPEPVDAAVSPADLAEARQRAAALPALATDPDDNERGVYPSEIEGAMP